MYINGYANLEDTKSYINKRGLNRFIKNTSSFCNLPIAIGTHLGNFSDKHSELYVECLKYGLNNGVNFIDTAINYRGMRSERDIGKALNELIIKENSLKRSEIIVSTKGGQIVGDIKLGLKPIDYLDEILIKEGIIKREDVNFVENHRHTLVSKYYEYVINLSKKNMGIETIDIHYIHNPEISMKVLGEHKFYLKLEELFKFYESEVDKGNIKSYGMATWNAFLEEIGSDWYISLQKVINIAKKVAGENNHFKFIQLPFNKKMNFAATKRNQMINGKYLTAFEAAKELGLYVTTSAPLIQGKEFNEDKFTPKELLEYVLKTDGVYAAMVGTKRIEHLKNNMQTVIRSDK